MTGDNPLLCQIKVLGLWQRDSFTILSMPWYNFKESTGTEISVMVSLSI